MGATVLLQDGVPVDAPALPGHVLAQRSGGAYTTALVLPGQKIVDWELHVERLASNIECLHREREPRTFDAVLQWCKLQARPLREAVQQLVEPQVKAALALLDARLPPLPPLPPPPPPPPQQQQQQQEHVGQEGSAAMLVVILTEPPGGPPSTQSAAAATTPTISDDAGVGGGPAGGEAAAAPPLSVAVFCKAMALEEPEAGRVVARGAPRQWARAKHCSWVLQRRELEASKPPGVAEVVLVDERGGLLEGLVTNFYVVAEAPPSADGDAGAAPSAPSGAASADLSRFELQTATGAGDEVLPGTSQRRVLEAARALGLRVRAGAPLCEERGTWREAFITNSLRGLQPVSSVAFWPDGPSPEWEQQLAAGGNRDSGDSGGAGGAGGVGPVTLLLRATVEGLRQLTPASDLPGPGAPH